MKYLSDQLERFDLLDREWTLAHWTGDTLAVWVEEPEIMTGEDAGQRPERALVTFRGIELLEAGTHVDQQDVKLTADEARELFARETMFVFSYGIDGLDCDFCGLGSGTVLYMHFGFRSVTVEWDAFTGVSEPLVGELRKL